jgi:hypothetical protein
MAILSTISVLVGVVLGLHFKVLVLVPVIGLAWVVVVVGIASGETFWQLGIAFAAVAISVQQCRNYARVRPRRPQLAPHSGSPIGRDRRTQCPVRFTRRALWTIRGWRPPLTGRERLRAKRCALRSSWSTSMKHARRRKVLARRPAMMFVRRLLPPTPAAR